MTSDDVPDVLVRSLAGHNPWWRDGADALDGDLPPRQKSDFYHLARPDGESSQFAESAVVGLVGRHGVGKTTLFRQFVQHELTGGTAPERFCYVPFDANALYQLHSADQFRRALRHYEGRILGRLDDPDPHYLLLDDVHRITHDDKPGVDGWGAVVRDALDAGGDGRNVVVAAGAAEHVERELDRVGIDANDRDVQPILPEKFRDHVFATYPDLEAGDIRVSPTPLRRGEGSLPRALETGDVEPLLATLREQYDRVDDVSRRIQSQVVHYLALGGVLSFIADGSTVEAVDDDAHQRLYRNLTATLYQDAPSLESIRTIADLERLCALAARNRASEPIRFQRLVDLFDVDRRTVRDSYLSVLEQLFVLTAVTEYDNQRPRSGRLYLRDTGLVSALGDRDPRDALDDLDYEADLARVAAFDHTMRLAYGVNAAQGFGGAPSVQYWRGRSGTVDFVFEVGGSPVAVALAYRSSERQGALDALEEFGREYEAPATFLVTGETSRSSEPVSEVGSGVVELPYWFYSLLC